MTSDRRAMDHRAAMDSRAAMDRRASDRRTAVTDGRTFGRLRRRTWRCRKIWVSCRSSREYNVLHDYTSYLDKSETKLKTCVEDTLLPVRVIGNATATTTTTASTAEHQPEDDPVGLFGPTGELP